MTDAQVSFDRFCERVGDGRPRPLARLVDLLGSEDQATEYLAQRAKSRPSVADLAACEPLMALPAAPYPVTVTEKRVVSPACLVAFEANSYGVPPGLIGAEVTVRHRLGTETVEVVTAGGIVVSSHRRRTPGAGYVVRDPDQRAALEAEVLAAFSSDPPCRRKANRPPGQAARAEAQKLLRGFEDADVVVSLDDYQAVTDELAVPRQKARS